jgi:hypothetical protein
MTETKKDLKDSDPLCFTKITQFENQLRKGKAKSYKGKGKGTYENASVSRDAEAIGREDLDVWFRQ